MMVGVLDSSQGVSEANEAYGVSVGGGLNGLVYGSVKLACGFRGDADKAFPKLVHIRPQALLTDPRCDRGDEDKTDDGAACWTHVGMVARQG
jgi:hypothetical protein